MNIYKVGGCVRDALMGVEPKDIDYCVTGATPDVMINLGYLEIEADFPIFIHPETRDEYALARKERKNDKGGYNGFDVVYDTSVTLQDDLFRRDLTINAIAQNDRGDYIDPFDGRKDIENKVIRHVSKHFVEDPVRALRIARFCARWGEEWTVHESTVALIKEMHSNGELDNLTRERVWKELSRAIMEPHAHLFFERLLEWGILDTVLGGRIDGSLRHSPEFDRLKEACRQNQPLPVRLAMTGLNSIDLERIKADSNIVKFVSRLYDAMLHIELMTNGRGLVLAYHCMNLYQNENNRKWFFGTMSVFFNEAVGKLHECFYNVSKDISFDDLDDEARAKPPATYKESIGNLRGDKIDEYAEQALAKLAAKDFEVERILSRITD